MSIDEKKAKIKSLLESLDDESLQSSHKSVFASFTHMLGYIEQIGEPKQEEIRTLLRAYQGMAEWFYTQYEFSLLMEISEQRNIHEQAERAVEKLQKLKPPSVKDEELDRAIQVLETARAESDTEYRNLIRNYPALMQVALDKLRDEWQRLNGIATASAALTQDETLIRILTAVATAAAISVELKTARILIVPGNAFALYFFSYVENLAVLTVPIYSVRAPWEWSIFWHELAGYKVRQLENDLAINQERRKLEAFHEEYKAMGQNRKKELLAGVVGSDGTSKGRMGEKNQFSLEYLTKVFSADPPDLRDFGGFEYQFEQVLAKVTRRKRIQYYEQLKAEGWCVDWFKELYEDACSVVAIRAPFLIFFQDILSRHATADQRHPPSNIRLSVAKELLNLLDPENKVPNKPSPMEKAVANQILKFMSLLMAASPLFEAPAVDESQSFDYNRVKGKFFLSSFPEIVGAKIGGSIQDWAENLIGANPPADNGGSAVPVFESMIEQFSNQALDRFTKFAGDELARLIEYIEKEIEIRPSHDKLPADTSYRQLVALSFYERDFLSSHGITQVFYNRDGIPALQAIFNDTSQSDFIIDSYSLTLRTVNLTHEGEVTFDLNALKWATTRTNWNNAFPANSPFPNIRQYNIQ